jgi:hypothetical protein
MTAFVLAISAVSVGLYRGWFAFATAPSETASRDKVDVTVTIDKARIKQDAQTARQTVEDITGQAQKKILPKGDADEKEAQTTTLVGTIQRVDVSQRQLVVAKGSSPGVTVQVDNETTILLNEKPVPLGSLMAGDDAKVELADKEGAKLAKSVSATRKVASEPAT